MTRVKRSIVRLNDARVLLHLGGYLTDRENRIVKQRLYKQIVKLKLMRFLPKGDVAVDVPLPKRKKGEERG